MNRKRILASTTLAAALGLSALAPAVASADPVITGPTEQQQLIGETANISGSGCVAPGGGQTYGGVYFRIPSIPGLDTWQKGMEVPATDGEFGWVGQSEGFAATDWEFTFFCSTDSVPADQLSGLVIGGNVRLREGAYLIKIQSDPKTYAVEPDGLLRWVQTEAQAKALYGTAWNTRVRDVDVSLFADYRIGSPLQDGERPAGYQD